MPHAFGAFGRLNLVNVHAHGNRTVGTFGFAHVAVNAFVGNG
jgi:hypothetical protein